MEAEVRKMAVKAKPFWQSSTLWINFIGIVAIILEVVIKSDLIPDADIIAIIVALLNILNRFRNTLQPLKLK